MKKRKSLRSKFIGLVVAEYLVLSIVSTMLLTGIYRHASERMQQKQTDKMMEMINSSVNVYFQRMNLLFYSFQNNSRIQEILRKDSYETNRQMYEDMEMMKQILKNAMVGEEYIQNIALMSENGMYCSGGGTSVNVTRSTLQGYQHATANKEIGFTVEFPKDHYSYTKIHLVKEMEMGANAPKAWLVMTVSCKGMYRNYEQSGYEGALLVFDAKERQMVYKRNEKLLEADEEELLGILEECGGESGIVRRIGGKTFFITCHQSAFTGWENYMMIPNGVLREDTRFMLAVCIALTALFAVIAVLLTAKTANYFLKNITMLTKSVGQIDTENMQIRLPITSGDEVEQLYHSFEHMTERLAKEIEENKESERKKIMLEQQALQAQIKPHFLYNTLHTIKVIAGMLHAEAVVDITSALSTIMQSNMSASSFHTFSEECDYLKKYMCIREYQYAGEIPFFLEIEEELLGCRILKMLIQPLVENSIKHGGILERADGRIEVKITSEGRNIRIEVYDNGEGMDEEQWEELCRNHKEQGGIGLYNVARRIRLHYGEEYGLTLRGEKGSYTRIVLMVPRETEV